MKPPGDDSRFARSLRQIGGKHAGAGITFGGVIVLFSLGGYALDAWLGTLPLCLLIGLGLGAVGGFIHLVESVSPGTLFPKRKKRKKD